MPTLQNFYFLPHNAFSKQEPSMKRSGREGMTSCYMHTTKAIICTDPLIQACQTLTPASATVCLDNDLTAAY